MCLPLKFQGLAVIFPYDVRAVSERNNLEMLKLLRELNFIYETKQIKKVFWMWLGKK